MALLRKVEYAVNGVYSAWEETFLNWNQMCKNLSLFPKSKAEEAQIEPFHRSVGKRRASHQNSEHELEDQINEWANMTGFLVALGGVCLQKKQPPEMLSKMQNPQLLINPQLSQQSLSCSLASSTSTSATNLSEQAREQQRLLDANRLAEAGRLAEQSSKPQEVRVSEQLSKNPEPSKDIYRATDLERAKDKDKDKDKQLRKDKDKDKDKDPPQLSKEQEQRYCPVTA